MLTDLQRRVRGIVAGLPEGAAVALVGGGALIVTGVVRRGTDDLDFFAAHPQPVAPMLDAFETGLREAGLRVTRLRASDTYARLLIESDSDATDVDLATDYRMMPALETGLAPPRHEPRQDRPARMTRGYGSSGALQGSCAPSAVWARWYAARPRDGAFHAGARRVRGRGAQARTSAVVGSRSGSSWPGAGN